MNTEHNYDLITAFADSHETSREVAEAIFAIATSEEDAQRIWEDPAQHEAVCVWERATNNGLLDGDDFYWGVDTLQTVLDQFA